MISDPPTPTSLRTVRRADRLRRDKSVIGDQLEAAASAEASADTELWRDLPSSDYSEMLKLVRCPHSLIASLATLPSMSLIPFAPFASWQA